MSYIGYNAVCGIVALYPFKAFGVCISLPEGSFLLVEFKQVSHIFVKTHIKVIFKHVPVYALLFVPFGILAYIIAHKEQFLSRICVHKSVSRSEVSEFLPCVSGHLSYHGALHMNYLIVGKHKHKVFRIGIGYAEGKVIMMILSVNGVLLHIFKEVIHPAHIPFE